jgi:hypothetical protein
MADKYRDFQENEPQRRRGHGEMKFLDIV